VKFPVLNAGLRTWCASPILLGKKRAQGGWVDDRWLGTLPFTLRRSFQDSRTPLHGFSRTPIVPATLFAKAESGAPEKREFGSLSFFFEFNLRADL
jgi:hypothetical protein